MNKFKDIPGFPGYKINKLGQILSPKGRILAMQIDDKGYPRVTLIFGKKHKVGLIHRLLALTFIPNPKKLPEINHKDGNKTNNSLNNLEWVTHQDNVTHAMKTGLHVSSPGERNGNAILSEEDVQYIRKHYIPWKHGQRKRFAEMFGVCPSLITYVVTKTKRRLWKHI